MKSIGSFLHKKICRPKKNILKNGQYIRSGGSNFSYILKIWRLNFHFEDIFHWQLGNRIFLMLKNRKYRLIIHCDLILGPLWIIYGQNVYPRIFTKFLHKNHHNLRTANAIKKVEPILETRENGKKYSDKIPYFWGNFWNWFN